MMTAVRLRRSLPAPSLPVFFALQALDVLTTMIGLHAGAAEASVFVGRLMQFGPLQALLIAKMFALILVAAAISFKRARVIVFLNYWFAAVITWNLFTIMSTLLSQRA